MKNALIIMLAFVAILPAVLSADLPTCYYTYAQIESMLTAYEAANSDIAKLYTIGFSQQDNVPIYAMRISDNVAADESEPALLFVGQVHAEEVLGVQITMSNIAEILANRQQPPYTQWISQLDLWFIPTLNPEGHNVVTSNMDVSYRKNKRDNNLNGIFDFVPSTGYDIDGVDNNRNFDFNWVHGDSLMQPGGLEVYDYYRGPAPMSESENRALKNLSEQYKFIYSVCWHSSRTGNFSEKVYYPFNWKEVRPSPDLQMAMSIAQGVGAQILKEDGTAPYEVYPNLSRKGAFHDWMYKEYGTMALLIECGTRNIQPDSTLMVNTVARCNNGVRWLINRALMFSTSVPTSSMLKATVTSGGTPVEAEIIVEQLNAPWFIPRTSFASTGIYYRPLQAGNYTVRAKKKGYFDTVLNSVNVLSAAWTNQAINLNPLPAASMDAYLRSGQTPISGRVIIGSYQPDTLSVEGNFAYFGHAGEYPIQIYAEGYFPYLGTLNLAEGYNYTEFNLSPSTTVFSENWETDTGNWEIQGPWVRQNELSSSGYAITDSWGGNGFYEMNCNVWIKSINPVYIPPSESVYLMFDSHLYSEWDYDPARVEVSTNGTDWQQVWQKSGKWDSWQKEFVSLSAYGGQNLYLRFRLSDVSTHAELTDPGWTIDNIAIVSGMAVPNSDETVPGAAQTALLGNFPNPFNPETTIKFSLAEVANTRLSIYNLKGQLVRNLIEAKLDKGNHQIVFNGCDNKGNPVASGVYFYRFEGGKYTSTKKMLIMK